jgi:hypothetical protein
MLAEATWQDVFTLLINQAVPILTAVGVIVTALISWRNNSNIGKVDVKADTAAAKVNEVVVATASMAERVEVIHKATNGMKAQLEAVAYDKGVAKEKADEKERKNDKDNT